MNKFKHYFFIFCVFVFHNPTFGFEIFEVHKLQSSNVDLIPNYKGDLPLTNLKFLSGLEITGNHPKFGGLSGLVLSSNFDFFSVSDKGYWIKGKLDFNEEFKLKSLSNVTMGYLKDENNVPFNRKSNTDAEAIEILNNKFIISFERNHRVLSYDTLESHSKTLINYKQLSDLPNNGGIESISPLKDSSLLLLSEDLVVENDKLIGFRFFNHEMEQLLFKKTGDYKPTDIASLPSGDILLLERSFSPIKGASARISLIKFDDLFTKSLIEPIHLDTISPPMTVDNFEGISYIYLKNGGYHIFILSDDNYRSTQRTLLMQFYWNGKV